MVSVLTFHGLSVPGGSSTSPSTSLTDTQLGESRVVDPATKCVFLELQQLDHQTRQGFTGWRVILDRLGPDKRPQQLARIAAPPLCQRAAIDDHLLVVLADPLPHRLELGHGLGALPEFGRRAAVFLSAHCGPAADRAGGRSA
ncbi:hypothetical protein EYF80_033089 [Liparis tanakae]|uniref:Uncharacterized protein n=1 Tax=Liparis tanakae TaxID=230148 RepID=A0A4Z2GV94_9TELE|nr:hypothetical protein EYF80_033089 [Liparis tanakae]